MTKTGNKSFRDLQDKTYIDVDKVPLGSVLFFIEHRKMHLEALITISTENQAEKILENDKKGISYYQGEINGYMRALEEIKTLTSEIQNSCVTRAL